MDKITVRQKILANKINKFAIKKKISSFIEENWTLKNRDIAKKFNTSKSKVLRYRQLLEKGEPINLFHGNSEKTGKMVTSKVHEKIYQDFKKINLTYSNNTKTLLTPIQFCRIHPDYDESMRRKVARALVYFNIEYPRMSRHTKNKMRAKIKNETGDDNLKKSNYYYPNNSVTRQKNN
ncbi:hypothetical protein EI74_0015 [Mycoplasma testudineum]|uniref:Uncharacterized protein n=1 Tax=Mycoplasma testudineum TaxID=244584 RepID=A0A4V3C3I5_9MOLU|nr:hypothetical protein [Mycoplasma testudineum]OYD26456.1 hypothetical protein CG473_03895 [Mycoplasma testudineum]TDO22158.1 hypothetical protein EI74_0015 [Mycoplasma testudineum]